MALAMAGLDRSTTHPMPSSTDTPHTIQPISLVAHLFLTLENVGAFLLTLPQRRIHSSPQGAICVSLCPQPRGLKRVEAPRFSVVDNGSVIFMASAMAGLDRSPTDPKPSSTDTPHSIRPISRGPGFREYKRRAADSRRRLSRDAPCIRLPKSPGSSSTPS